MCQTSMHSSDWFYLSCFLARNLRAWLWLVHVSGKHDVTSGQTVLQLRSLLKVLDEAKSLSEVNQVFVCFWSRLLVFPDEEFVSLWRRPSWSSFSDDWLFPFLRRGWRRPPLCEDHLWLKQLCFQYCGRRYKFVTVLWLICVVPYLVFIMILSSASWVSKN